MTKRFSSTILRLLPLLIATALVIVVLMYWVVQRYQPDRKMLGLELVKTLMQVTTVLVLGQVVSVIVKEHEAQKERIAALTTLRLDLLTQLSRVYVGIKRYRRLLRAHAVTPAFDGVVDANIRVRQQPYDENMRAINETELELEALWHQLQALPASVTERETVNDGVESMKDYLRELLEQYEDTIPNFSLPADTMALQAFVVPGNQKGNLPDYIGPTKDSLFRQAFIQAFRSSTQAIRTQML